MIAMADDAYQLKQIENIDTYDGELMLSPTGPYNTNQGIIYQKGGYITTDFSDDEDKIIIRDMDGVIIDIIYGNESEESEENVGRENITSLTTMN
jgi:hypothetical protein